MLELFSDSKVYILCPQNAATGGIETLHQLSFGLQQMGIKAFMLYRPITDNPVIKEQYLLYNPVPVNTIEDEAHNVVVIPEIYIDYSIDDLTKIRKVIWWLSVDNYLMQKYARPVPGLDFIRKRNMLNLVQSAHTRAFLLKHKICADAYLSGYINASFRQGGPDLHAKTDTVLYNPKKGGEYTARLVEAAPELNWVPLANMTPAQVKQSFLTAKVYIDFGNHPGRDRFPREAAAMKCCIITGMRGAAAYAEDVPIPGIFKFNEATAVIDDIIKTIKYCLAEYEFQIRHFTVFSDLAKNEEVKFNNDLKNIFKYTITKT